MSDHLNYGTHADDEDWTSGDEHDQPVNDAAWIARVRPCALCGTPTAGSRGAAGIFWPDLCQPCKDKEDQIVRANVKVSKLLWDYINAK